MDIKEEYARKLARELKDKYNVNKIHYTEEVEGRWINVNDTLQCDKLSEEVMNNIDILIRTLEALKYLEIQDIYAEEPTVEISFEGIKIKLSLSV